MERAQATTFEGPDGPPEADGGSGGLSDAGEGADAIARDLAAARSRGLLTRLLVWLFAAYKRWLSPLLPQACRFTPTCSEYARLAVLEYGPWRGGVKALGRILRCNPFHPGGIDLP